MAEFAEYVNNGASFITPRIVDTILRQLPIWKVEFTQINAPKFPHLINQLEFLADAVEDFVISAEPTSLEAGYDKQPSQH